ncbi:MAG: FtsX-like permease family protein [Clostridiales Family XIII bacterium]|jgi:putative ABC transport system permease protein|nr:FtsX-like permease family protein [Clostridiales Family XIII bacterium]
MNIFTLAFRNVRKSFRDYGIYFLTIMIGVALFYIFNSLESQSVMMDLTQDSRLALLGISQDMNMLSGFVAAILGFLIVYANAFLIRRRKKELGIYMLLGMKKGKISAVLLVETFLVGLVSLAIGILLGVFLSQGMALITAKLFSVSVSHFAFVFSADAARTSVLDFGVAFVVVVLFNVININRQKLLNLINAEKRTQQFHKIPMAVSILLFILSAIMLGVAYHIMLTNGFAGFFDESKRVMQLISVILGVVGTMLFFFSLSGFLLRLISKIKGVYFKGLNIFTLKQLSSKMHTAFLSQTFVCLMLFLSISGISVGNALSSALRDNPRETTASIGIAYMSFYIGMVFLLTCASVLAITQLSEASDNQARYKLLGKLGAPAKMLSKSLFTQILVYFLLPLVLAIAHSFVGIKVMCMLIDLLGDLNIFATSITAGGMLVLLYGGYFLVTYLNARKMIR